MNHTTRRMSPSDKLYAESAEAARRMIDIEETNDISVFAPKVIEALRGNADVFQMLDEKSTYFPDFHHRHWLLRSVRNHPIWGKALFESFRR